MIKKVVSVAVAALTAGAGLVSLGATTADAASSDGKIIAKPSLSVRYAPSSHAKYLTSIKYGKVVPLNCKVTGTSVGGNNRWYLLPGDSFGGHEWIAARYVTNIGSTPGWCGNSERFVGRATTTVSKRTGPTTADPRSGSIARGVGVDIICKLPSQSVNGNKLWYWTTDHKWVSARYIDNVGRAPNHCV
ncbi:hypothetical protein [Microlunatus soli]|uniref:SH3 domain-containing protein n=1 Tax=Microlunatus soli TaxID=630515 RepID=A0A1H1QXS5_9ACTN|nr:hypothetical protein [Microlunatus soli]SDS28318.1 hypothetical protein SAMN04489812_1432 [Microlunatus soli]